MDHRISRIEGDERIKLFLTIKNEILDSPLFNSLSPQAQAYLSSAYLSFAFEKPFLDALGQSVGANGLRVYHAATPTTGVPTLVIYPCEISPSGYGGTVTNLFGNQEASSQAAGAQHPGLSPTPLTGDNFKAEDDTGSYDNG